MKIIIDTGHFHDTYDKYKEKGTILLGEKIEEYNLNKIISDELYQIFKKQGHDVYRTPQYNESDIGKERTDLSDRYGAVNKISTSKEDICISIHHDAGESSGFTIYTYKGNNKTSDIKNKITQKLKLIGAIECSLNNNGYSVCYKGHQGFAMVCKTDCNALLIEVGFFTNRKDVDFTKNNYKKISMAIYCGILGIPMIENVKNTEAITASYIISKCLTNPELWEKAKKAAAEKYDLGDTEIIKYLDELVIKIFNYGREYDK